MTTYLRPGAFVEEALQPLTEASSDPSEAAAAFIGVTTAGGPAGPTLVTSWNQFQTLFGGLHVGGAGEDLSYAVYSFFNNGGTSAYIVRAMNATATPATLTLTDGAGTPVQVLVVSAQAPGTWASAATSTSRVYVSVQPGPSGTNRFDLTIEVGTGSTLAAREQFIDLSMNPNDTRYVLDVVNSPGVGSKFVTLALAGGYTYNATTPVNPTAVTKVPLTGGSDGTGTPDVYAATQRLEVLDKNLVINVPLAGGAELTNIVTWAATNGRHFVVADAPKPASGETPAASVTALTTFAGTLPASSHVALYGPWIYIADPASRAGAMRLTAPGGAVVGQYLRTDATRGVHKAPAGVQTQIVSAISPYTEYTAAQQDTLAVANINLIKTLPGNGVVIWGTRTRGSGYPDKYIPIRRTLIALKSGLTNTTRFAVFEPNGEDLWATVEDAVDSYLNAMFNLGTFAGANASEAYYVTCDQTNNSPADQQAGVVNVEVGVALKNPAEFIIIRLGQTQTGTTAVDSLEED